MSAVSTTVDYKGQLVGWIHGLTGMLVADINALPEEALTKSFGGVTRPTNELIADAIGLANWITGHLTGNPGGGIGEEDYIKAFTAKMATKDAAIAEVKRVCGAFADAVAAASDDTLNTVITTPWGMESSIYSLSHIAASHIWYHDGQINYIQALNGDEKVHWMGD